MPLSHTREHVDVSRILTKLPPELYQDIYKYTLRPSRPVVANDVSRRWPLYEPDEYFRKDNSELKRPLLLFRICIFGTAPTIESDVNYEAHLYFLQHNVFLIYSRGGSNALVHAAKELSPAVVNWRPPPRIYGLQVIAQWDPVPGEDMVAYDAFLATDFNNYKPRTTMEAKSAGEFRARR